MSTFIAKRSRGRRTSAAPRPPRRLLQGIELVADRRTKEPAEALGRRTIEACLDLGLHLNIVQFPGSSSMLRIAPPLTISDEDLDHGVSLLDEALTQAERAG